MFGATYLKDVINLVKSCKLCFALAKYVAKCKEFATSQEPSQGWLFYFYRYLFCEYKSGEF